jgi:uncharacterized protein (TIGR02145 family)
MRKTLFYFLFCGTIFAGCQKDNNSNDNSNTTTATSHSCGAANVHNTNKTYGSVTDVDGNTYKTIQIGTQTWMAENLKTTKYKNGVSIPNITDNAEWANTTNGASCSYDNNAANDCPYGKLYNWYATTNTNGLCPTGWHVPTDAEWSTLTTFLGGESVAGGKMKSTGTDYWLTPNQDATNSSGFSGLPGGGRGDFNGSIIFVGRGSIRGIWRSTTEVDATNSWNRYLDHNESKITVGYYDKSIGASVRCVKD